MENIMQTLTPVFDPRRREVEVWTYKDDWYGIQLMFHSKSHSFSIILHSLSKHRSNCFQHVQSYQAPSYHPSWAEVSASFISSRLPSADFSTLRHHKLTTSSSTAALAIPVDAVASGEVAIADGLRDPRPAGEFGPPGEYRGEGQRGGEHRNEGHRGEEHRNDGHRGEEHRNEGHRDGEHRGGEHRDGHQGGEHRGGRGY
jgi:hypothetical protein